MKKSINGVGKIVAFTKNRAKLRHMKYEFGYHTPHTEV